MSHPTHGGPAAQRVWRGRRPNSGRVKLTAALILVSCIVGIGAAVASDWSVDAQLVLAVTCVLLGGLLIRWATAGLDPFEPLVMFVLAWLVMFVIRPGSMVSSGNLVFDTGISQTNLTETFPTMLTLGMLGALGFVLGYLSPAGTGFARRWRPPAEDATPDVLVTYALVIAAVGMGLS